MTVQYKNQQRETITAKQANYVSHYKEFYEEEILRKVEEYYVDAELGIFSLDEVIYYKQNEESDHSILESYYVGCPDSIGIRTRENYGDFKIERETKYWFKNYSYIKPWINNYLFDSSMNLMCVENIDVETPTPNFRIIWKLYFYHGGYDMFVHPHFSFQFDEDGSFKLMEEQPDPLIDEDREIYYVEEAMAIVEKFPLSDSIKKWYFTDTFLPPL